MNYPVRISIALLVACGVVAATLAATPRVLRRMGTLVVLPAAERPVFVDLRRLEPAPRREEPVKRLVDSGAVSEGPVKETDLISDRASQAQDQSEQMGDPARAAVDKVDEFEELATPPASAPAPTPAAEAATEAPAPEKAVEPAVASSAPEPAVDLKPAVVEAVKERKTGVVIEPAAKVVEAVAQKPVVEAAKGDVAPPERFQVAAAPPSPKVPVQELRAERGREGGGAEQSGFTSFEANKHVLGEYMMKVRNRVEREWRTALHLRYAGVSRTAATIHCVIRPDGTIESVSILDAGDSLTYSVLCRDAVERAGPFGPFPFDVPEIYRTQNLEINWKFSYL